MLITEVELVKEFVKIKLETVTTPEAIRSFIAALTVVPSLRDRIVTALRKDDILGNYVLKIHTEGIIKEATDNTILIKEQIVVPWMTSSLMKS